MPDTRVPPEFDAFLAEPRNAIMCIARGPGRPPHATPVWFEYRDGVFRISITRTRVKYRLLLDAPNVTLVIDDPVTYGTVYRLRPCRGRGRRRLARRAAQGVASEVRRCPRRRRRDRRGARARAAGGGARGHRRRAGAGAVLGGRLASPIPYARRGFLSPVSRLCRTSRRTRAARASSCASRKVRTASGSRSESARNAHDTAGRDECGATPPAVGRRRPVVDDLVAELPGEPCRARDQRAVRVDRAPVVDARAQRLDLVRMQRGERGAVARQQDVGERPLVVPAALDEPRGPLDGRVRLLPQLPARSPAMLRSSGVRTPRMRIAVAW